MAGVEENFAQGFEHDSTFSRLVRTKQLDALSHLIKFNQNVLCTSAFGQRLQKSISRFSHSQKHLSPPLCSYQLYGQRGFYKRVKEREREKTMRNQEGGAKDDSCIAPIENLKSQTKNCTAKHSLEAIGLHP